MTAKTTSTLENGLKRIPAPPAGSDPDQAEMLSVITAFRKGDLAARMPADKDGLAGKLADALNSPDEPAGRDSVGRRPVTSGGVELRG